MYTDVQYRGVPKNTETDMAQSKFQSGELPAALKEVVEDFFAYNKEEKVCLITSDGVAFTAKNETHCINHIRTGKDLKAWQVDAPEVVKDVAVEIKNLFDASDFKAVMAIVKKLSKAEKDALGQEVKVMIGKASAEK